MAWSALGHGLLILMSLAPVPMVDGGSILKWTLVERGRTEKAADEVVRQVDWAFGILLVVIGVALLFMRSWIIGPIFLGVAAIVFGIAAGKLRWS